MSANALRYHSTRGQAPEITFDEVLLTGLAPDGGLYLPKIWPEFSRDEWRAMQGLSYPEIAQRILSPFLAGSILQPVLPELLEKAYASFHHPAIAPLKQIGASDYVLELFHGPTLAFKDYALQIVGQMFDYVLTQQNRRATIVGATSGDTGSAAISAFEGLEAVDIIILYPKGRVSPVQQRQMTSVTASNVHTLAIEGTFDDCQNHVKAMFNDKTFRDQIKLSAINSINWGRIISQTVYYAAAATSVGAPDRPVSFTVPTGNFGNVFAGYVARQIGLPLSGFTIATNQNDILNRFIQSNDMRKEEVTPSFSPSMDIQISSNFERLLFDLVQQNGAAVRDLMAHFQQDGILKLTDDAWQSATDLMKSYRLDDTETLAAISELYQACGEVFCPHSIIGVKAGLARTRAPREAVISLATAHPAKFPDAVEQAIAIRPELPTFLNDLMSRPERIEEAPNDLAAIQALIKEKSRAC